MKYIDVEYNRELKSLEATLSGVKQPGDFYVAGVVEIPMPRVAVEGVGTLSFPVPRAQIDAVVQRATRAPYGRGEETIVDTSVRNVWQVAPGFVKISGKSWAASFESILSRVAAGLGCGNAPVSAEIYKLLVYDRGGFFLPHRDTEKTAGMFGTLVLTLPSDYRGGALRIRHADREVTVETNASDPSEIAFVAFYADCEHEALPVQDGTRVCLVFNLIQKTAKGKQRVVKAPNYESQVADAAAILEGYWNSPHAPPKIAWLLEHQYSPAGLSFASLKGADAARSRVLLQAAEAAGGVAHLGVVHIGETGGAEFDGGFDYYGDDEEQDDDFTAITVDDAWQYLDEWRDTEDRAVEFGRIPLSGGELLPAGALDDEPPDDRRLTEASGNEGATYERSYHRAALVLWRSDRTIDVLLKGGAGSTLPHLKRLVAGGRSARAEAMAAARSIAKAWRTDALRPEASHRAAMIATLAELDAPALLERFIRDAVAPAYDGSENDALLASVGVLENSAIVATFSALIEARMPDRPGACLALLLGLAGNPPPSFRKIANAAVDGLDGIGVPAAERHDNFRPDHLAPGDIENLFSALDQFTGRTLHAAAADKIASRPEVFDPVALIVPALELICAQRKPTDTALAQAIDQLWASAAEFLLSRSALPPQPPADWSLPAKLSCTCADCRELLAFALDPSERVHHFRINKERRRHLHQVVDRSRLDMTHVTVRSGSPQTLVCTKDRRTFKARVKEYQNEIAAMRSLLRLAPKSAAGLSKRMEAAVKASAT